MRSGLSKIQMTHPGLKNVTHLWKSPRVTFTPRNSLLESHVLFYCFLCPSFLPPNLLIYLQPFSNTYFSISHRGSNSRALKIAGLTTLACLLVASQVFTAYTVFSQKQQIHTLQKNSDRINKQLTRSSHGKVER